MARYLIRKFFYCSSALFLVVTLTFVLMKSIPGDPFSQEQALPKEIYEALRNHYGLNDPLPTQYFRYLKQLMRLDLGPSFTYVGRDVMAVIKEGFPISALLGIEALALALPLGLLFGTIAALKQNRWQDITATLFAVIGISLPSFIFATFLQYILAIKWEILPIARWGTLTQTILPTLSLAALPMAFITRLTRSKMIEELRQDYVKTARAKGLSETLIIWRHALRNVLIPILSYLSQLIANIVTGSFIIEKIFSIPGLGFWFVSSVLNRDYTLIMGITLFYCALLLFTVLLIGLLCQFLDPRLLAARKNGDLT